MKVKTGTRIALSVRDKKYFKYQAILALVFVALFIFSSVSYAAECSNIVINEVQITGGSGKSNEDFIELLNMGSESCNLKGHRIVKRTESGTIDTSIKVWESDVEILPWRYYLWANSNNGFANKINADTSTTQSISSDNGIALRYGLNDTGKIVDALGWGTSRNIFSDVYLFPHNPNANQSLERNIDGIYFLQTLPNPKNSENIFKEDDEEDLVVVNEKNLCAEISLNEIYPFGDNEYIEVKNNEDHSCDLSDWKIRDEAGHKIEFFGNKEVKSGEFLVLEGNLFLNNDEEEYVYLLNANENEIDKIKYVIDFSSQDKSYSYFEDGWEWTKLLTPGKKNELDEEDIKEDKVGSLRIDNPSSHTGSILINEFLPTPVKGEDEFVELYNAGEKQEDLFGWALHDATKSGEYIFKDHVILEAKKFLVLVGDVFKFALNSSKETLTLRDVEGKIVSQIYYDKSKSGASYNWTGSKWRWSKFLTPGQENIFNNEPIGKISLPDEVYEKVYADFSISVSDSDGEKIKVTWDFGDGHKSYKAITRHKYQKKGKYDGSVKYSDESEDIIQNFTIDVGQFPHPKVRIVAINANPEGSDTQNETITIENQSKKKINLLGWSIATGSSSKKLVNYPVREDFEINKKKSKEITRDFSSFSLNNKKGKIELRYPDGEVASKVKYKKEEGIEEGEIYQKDRDGWKWILSQKSIKSIKSVKQEEENSSEEEDLIPANVLVELEKPITKSQETNNNQETIPNDQNNEKLDVEFLKNHSEIEILDDLDVIEGIIIREENGQYYFTPVASHQEHYAVTYLKNSTASVNARLNLLLNSFSN